MLSPVLERDMPAEGILVILNIILRPARGSRRDHDVSAWVPVVVKGARDAGAPHWQQVLSVSNSFLR